MSAAVVASSSTSSAQLTSSSDQQQLITENSNQDADVNKQQEGNNDAFGDELAPENAADPEKEMSTAIAENGHSSQDDKDDDNKGHERMSTDKSFDTKLEIPLAGELLRVLTEVARTGTCSWLPWSEQDAPTATEHTHDLSATTAPVALKAPSIAASPLSSHFASRQQPTVHSSHRRNLYTNSSSMHASASMNKRKKQRSSSLSQSGRKRPLFLIRTTAPSGVAIPATASATGTGSGIQTSGSELEDASHYDSEGTSATSNSEFSVDNNRIVHNKQSVGLSSYSGASKLATLSLMMPATETVECGQSALPFGCQKDAFQLALCAVLDHFYNRVGYKLSPVEKQQHLRHRVSPDRESGSEPAPAERESFEMSRSSESVDGKSVTDEHLVNDAVQESVATPKALSTEANVFFQRRQRLLTMLQAFSVAAKSSGGNGAPFTIQRIAEVLIAPGRYYTQTHKLCNCLEKLLLITSSANAFGGSTGGETSQSLLEEREMAALAEEQERLQCEIRRQRLKRRASSFSDEGKDIQGCSDAKRNANDDRRHTDTAKQEDSNDGSDGTTRELFLEAAARASLRTKFDHVCIDSHSAVMANTDARAIAENRGMTNSPPPPSCSLSASNLSLTGHNPLLRHGNDGDHLHGIGRSSPPILFNGATDSSGTNLASLSTSANIHLLHLHHVAALAGISPFDYMSLHSENPPSLPSNLSALSALGKEVDTESRSSCSSDIDIDSESDVSFDDSASDRSDGSDSGHTEPLSAARAMALNRMHQQQRLQNRMLTSLHLANQNNAFSSATPSETFRQDSDYPSREGECDSFDSTRAEDSAESDSSSSSMND
jgi:hypothetical protein